MNRGTEEACSIPDMVLRKDLKRHPRDYMINPDDWPHGDLEHGTHPVVLLLRDTCVQLHNEFEGTNDEGKEWTFRQIAKDCQLDHKSVYDLWHGYSWGTLPVLASIEIYLRLDERLGSRAHIVEARHWYNIPQRGKQGYR